MGEIGELLLQSSQLGRERAQGLEGLAQLCGQSQRLCRGGRNWQGRLLGQRGQMAMMRQPTAQGFGINGKVPTTVGQ